MKDTETVINTDLGRLERIKLRGEQPAVHVQIAGRVEARMLTATVAEVREPAPPRYVMDFNNLEGCTLKDLHMPAGEIHMEQFDYAEVEARMLAATASPLPVAEVRELPYLPILQDRQAILRALELLINLADAHQKEPVKKQTYDRHIAVCGLLLANRWNLIPCADIEALVAFLGDVCE